MLQRIAQREFLYDYSSNPSMSNSLAIATVRATMQRLLQEGIQKDIPGARVTTATPDGDKGCVLEVGVPST